MKIAYLEAYGRDIKDALEHLNREINYIGIKREDMIKIGINEIGTGNVMTVEIKMIYFAS